MTLTSRNNITMMNARYPELSTNGNIASSDYEFLSGFSFRLFETIEIFFSLVILGSLWTSLSLTVRRIRDVGMTWQWIFLAKLPVLGEIFALIFLTRTSIQEIDGKKYYLKYCV